jgi:hypothetical protein
MSSTKRLEVSEIDFENIRSNLKEFLQSQDTLQDYDFEGSAITSIIDLLSYVTHYNAINANLGLNETFIDTAQFRGSVVGHARQLGYTPRSASAPSASLDLTVNNPSSQNLNLERGHRFRAKIGNTTYNFVTDTSYETDNAQFSNVRILQGVFESTEVIFDVNSAEKILIPSPDVDTTTILVEVFDTTDKTSSTIFTEAKELTDIDNDSAVYFLSENPDGLFEIKFGDDVLGQALENGNLVRVEYLVTKKTEANGARVFSLVDSINGNSNVSITVNQSAAGGAERESIDSVRRNAPLTFASQNRAVVPNDFEAVIRENFANVSSVKVWGGEDNDPPVYGRVFISALPETGDVLTLDEKDRLLNEVILPKSVITVTPELLDPEFLVITSEVFFKYDPSLTNLSEQQLENKAVDAINEFDDNKLGKFDNVFRYSQFLQAIDNADDAVLNSFARIYLSKRFVPALNIPTTYTLNFSTDLFRSFGTRPVIFDSSTFTVNGVTNCRFKDFLNSDGTRRVSIVTGTGTAEEVVIRNAGFIEESRIILESFAPESIDGEVINIEAVPASYDIVGTLNTVLTLDCDCSRFNVQGEVDTIVSGRDYSGVNYRTFNRDSESTGSTTTTTTNNISSTSSSTTTTSSTTNTSPPSSSSSTTTPPPSSSGY